MVVDMIILLILMAVLIINIIIIVVVVIVIVIWPVNPSIRLRHPYKFILVYYESMIYYTLDSTVKSRHLAESS